MASLCGKESIIWKYTELAKLGWNVLVWRNTRFVSRQKIYLVDSEIAFGAESLKVGIRTKQ